MLRRDLLHGLLATQPFQRKLGPKLICKVPALRLSYIPSSVPDTPQRAIQYCGTNSLAAAVTGHEEMQFTQVR